jgi:hypothetical protein
VDEHGRPSTEARNQRGVQREAEQVRCGGEGAHIGVRRSRECRGQDAQIRAQEPQHNNNFRISYRGLASAASGGSGGLSILRTRCTARSKSEKQKRVQTHRGEEPDAEAKAHRQRRTSHSEAGRRGGVAISDLMRATRRRGGKR